MSKTKNFICALEDSCIKLTFKENVFDQLRNKFYQFGDFWNYFQTRQLALSNKKVQTYLKRKA